MSAFIGSFGADITARAAHVTYQPAQAIQDALRLYDQASWAGRLGQAWTRLTGRSSLLLDLATLAATTVVHSRHAAGVQTIPLGQIQGSEGHCQDFDRAFHPLQQHPQARWVRVATAGLLDIALPPIKVIQLGEHYFVRDGHHRVSVAHALGQWDIEAVVTVWQMDQSNRMHAANDGCAIRRVR